MFIDVGRAALCILLALHTLNKGTSREGPWGNPSTNVLPWRAACMSCQLLKSLWSFGGNLKPSSAQGRLVLFKRAEEWSLHFLSDQAS